MPKATLILTNPPFGSKKGGGLPNRKDFTFPTSNKQFCFLQHIYRGLKPGGRATAVFPDNVLFDSNLGKQIRVDLMEKCNLHTILRLPTGIFYAQGVKTNVLFFTRGKKEKGNTQEVWVEDWREQRGTSVKWEATVLGSIGSVTGGLIKNTKRLAFTLRKPYLRVANVYANRLELDDVTEIGLTEAEFQKTLLLKSDILIVEGNGSLDQIGRAAIWNEDISDCVHQNHLIRWRSNGNVLPKFALFWLLSPEGRASLVQLASTTTGLYNLSISKI